MKQRVVKSFFTVSIAILGMFLMLYAPETPTQSSPQKDHSHTVDLIIFSYDRPLQLYALLESVDRYMKGLGQTYVIYRVDDELFNTAYEQVHKKFPAVHFFKQGANPQQDFKPLTVRAFSESPSPYVVFAVDDIVVKDTIDLSACVKTLEQVKGYGFFLRLGKNLAECYALGGCAQPLPTFNKVTNDILSWEFGRSALDWNYPHTVDMTIYRKDDIRQDVIGMNYSGPNLFEGEWNSRARRVANRLGLCFESSKIVNLPLNRVQGIYNNRAMNSLSPKELLNLFVSGKKMDIALLHNVTNKAAHMEHVPQFIDR